MGSGLGLLAGCGAGMARARDCVVRRMRRGRGRVKSVVRIFSGLKF